MRILSAGRRLWQGLAMNEIVRQIPASERHKFTVDDVPRMQEEGIIPDGARLELFEGELVRMQAKNDAHERIKSELIRIIAKLLPQDLSMGVETTAYLADAAYFDPDISIIPRHTDIRDIKGLRISLVIEIADATLAKERGVKAQLYAKHGVRELWVIDAKRLTTYRFAHPVDGVWSAKNEIAPDEPLTHPILSGLSVRLRDL
jgi:Uma2 family endonuclease